MTVFWSKVDRSAGTDGCWPWTGGVTADGYGRASRGKGRQGQAHRVAHECEYGPSPPSVLIVPTCRNRLCCNPRHLTERSRSQNTPTTRS
jgi:hypothetical protein